MKKFEKEIVHAKLNANFDKISHIQGRKFFINDILHPWIFVVKVKKFYGANFLVALLVGRLVGLSVRPSIADYLEHTTYGDWPFHFGICALARAKLPQWN